MGKRVGKVRGVLSALNPRRLHSRYRRAQLESPEDRFWLLYAQSDWDACNMHLEVRFDPKRSAHVKETLRARVSALLMTTDQSADLLRETGVFKDGRWGFVVERSLTLADLSVPRRGIWFDFDRPDRIRVTWNHIQVDGVALWRVMRLLFDENEPLLTYRRARRPVVMIPELRAIPSTLRKLGWKRTLTAGKPDVVHHAFNQWSARNVRRIKGQLDAPFNLTASALVVERVFNKHPEASWLNIALTVYFPFMESRNRYGAVLMRIKRGSLSDLVRQMKTHATSSTKVWGQTSLANLALARMSDRQFMATLSRARSQLDVLISNLPVSATPISMGACPVGVSCHADELTVPYYFLNVGTRTELHLSTSSRYPVSPQCFSGPT